MLFGLEVQEIVKKDKRGGQEWNQSQKKQANTTKETVTQVTSETQSEESGHCFIGQIGNG